MNVSTKSGGHETSTAPQVLQDAMTGRLLYQAGKVKRPKIERLGIERLRIGSEIM